MTGRSPDWRAVHAELSARDASSLRADELDALAESLFWLDRPDESIAARGRAFTSHVAAGDHAGAAMAAWQLFYDHVLVGEVAPANGWLERARRHAAQAEGAAAVAERVCRGVELHRGDVADLPFDPGTFDAALCQMALMFFPDRQRAIGEMGRVVKADGTVVVMVPSSLDAQPAYRLLVDLAARHAGPVAVSMLSAYWVCGDLDELCGTVRSAGLEVLSTRTRMGTARFDSIDEFVAVEVESTPVRERLSDGEYATLRREAHDVLAGFTAPDGTAQIPIEGHLVAARPR